MKHRGDRILFADDDPDDRYLTLEAAGEAGIRDRFLAVSDGEEAIEYLKKCDDESAPAPRLAILDVKMPKKNGFETLDWIRGSAVWRTLPVLLLSASTLPADVRRAYLSGANAYLIKPATTQDLVDMLVSIKEFWLRFAESSE